jgi:FtsP/CotA-like multicopper oxidase with cupredoxin domain
VHPQQTAFRQMVRVDLEARPTQWEVATGLSVPGYGFNGQVPGPTIQAEVGDTLVVRLANALPEPTTIHWHGLRVPADMDGTELVQHPSSREAPSSTGSSCPTPGPSGTTPTPTRSNSSRRACMEPLSCAARMSPDWTANGSWSWTT